MEESTRLNKDMIAEPRLWRLAMKVQPSMLEVVLYSTIDDNSLIHRRIALDVSSTTLVKALEETVYENPLLLCDFSRIDCVIDTDRYVIVPAEIDSPAVREKIMTASFPGFDGEMVVNTITEQSASILMGVDDRLLNFLRRTFNNPRISHYLTPLCRYFLHKSRRGNSAKMYVNMRDGSLDLLAFADGAMLMANTFRYREVADAVYYIMACRQQLSLDADSGEVYVLGNAADRENIVAMLRQYLKYVMPEVFPSELFSTLGRDSMKVSFDIIILPLCE